MGEIIGTDGVVIRAAQSGPSGLAVGRIVHWFQDEGDARKPEPRVYAAIVTRVHEDGFADLTVFMPGLSPGLIGEAPYHASSADATYRHQHWSWPPRVGV